MNEQQVIDHMEAARTNPESLTPSEDETMDDVKYPDIDVQLTGESGNALSIRGAVTKALKRGDVSSKEIDAFRTEAMSGDYDHVLQTAMKWVNVN